MKKAPPEPNVLLWEAFWEVRTMAVNGMGIAPVALDKLHWYANEELALEEDERRAFVWIMRRVDAHFVAKMAKKAEADRK